VDHPIPKDEDPFPSNDFAHRLRIMTYNVHGCIGSDLRFLPERVARVIESVGADIVALQEIYVEHPRSKHLHQAAWLAGRLGMHFEFGAARNMEGGGRYGNAVLSRHSLRVVRAEALPRLTPRREPRAALRVEVTTPLGVLDIVNTHLGLRPRERILQTTALATDWLSHVTPDSASILCGDLNAVPGSSVYETFARILTDAELAFGTSKPAKTWPALFPFMRLDHVFVGHGLRVVAWCVPSSHVERVASDHLPVVVDIVSGRRW
jgi:endonuclease/exonuclease/phosphatase family metal-dependent hydrolase